MCEATIAAGMSAAEKVNLAERNVGSGERVAGYKCRPSGMSRWISVRQVDTITPNHTLVQGIEFNSKSGVTSTSPLVIIPNAANRMEVLCSK